ncbi:nitric oxide synthase, salivary gland [Cephus cinctus]|uniref:Nitric oxide synthase n=1 Tax=Cephus cinctus TaxID=211228 RepID=A0AAJ7BZM3_CEPCN|nr:nitric oxide synthase, salivary gland [Cephus cinctus]
MKDHEQPPCQRKPTKLRNLIYKTEAFDSLHSRNAERTLCNSQVCLGSVMSVPSHGPKPRSKEEILVHAKDFLEQYFASIRRSNSDAHKSRWECVQKEVICTGTYQLTETELVFGAKLAWRNAARCIGRIQWSKLQVFDCRYVTTTSGMFEALCNHIKYSTNKGNIRSAITIFPQRTDGKHDYRVWNQQLIGYAGYKNPDGTITGDPANVEFTEVCVKLGWRGARTRFDILPIILSANGHDPDYFDIPSELVLEVPLTHPTYDWFEKMNLKWFAVPAVSGMVFDCGGLEFTAAPFNGWYMSTEIGARDLCDVNRYNLLETIATYMGLDTHTPISLWKDKAMIEANVAVLYSFQMHNVTIVDHHTASESFMKHYENEMRLRNGCPADWLWIVPPISGSATTVFHQEMALYHLKPAYDAQDPAWRTHVWKKGRDKKITSKTPRRKFHFKQIARAVKFTSKLFGRALSRRIKATVLFGTETGKSQMYAEKLGTLLGHAFHSQVLSMADYDISNIEHEALLVVVTSTFGNGDPPENGEAFAQNLYAMKMNETYTNNEKISLATSKSFIKANSQTEMGSSKKLDRLDSLRGSVTESQTEDTFGPLSNVRFAVFALGSSAYPNFCAFGRYVDNLLGELGGERLLRLAQGDEMCGQEQAFRKWAAETFAVACETFCLDNDDTSLEIALSLGSDTLSAGTVRFVESDPQPITKALSKCHNRNVTTCSMLKKTYLNGSDSSGATLLLELDGLAGLEIAYKPGDHLGVFACNRPQLVNGILDKLQITFDADLSIELQVQKQSHTPNGIVKSWVPHDRYMPNSLKMLLTRFLDITTPPTPNLLRYFASIATNPKEQTRLTQLATDSAAYEDWRHWKFPNLLEVLEEFPSVKPLDSLLILYLTPLQPRFYSISSSPLVHEGQIHLTVAVVEYRTQGGTGPPHYGVCSNYLRNISDGESLYVFVRSAPNFYMPPETKPPMILVGPGTGIAPFRGFWHHRLAQMALDKNNQRFGKIWLFFGCRQKDLDLYREEKIEMMEAGVLDKVFLALSREPGLRKTYVQDLIQAESSQIYNMIVHEHGHFYVCGDCTMAEDVYQTLKQIIQSHGQLTDKEVEAYMLSLRDETRYHEDIFGITLRTAEVHNRSRETARIRMASEP